MHLKLSISKICLTEVLMKTLLHTQVVYVKLFAFFMVEIYENIYISLLEV